MTEDRAYGRTPPTPRIEPPPASIRLFQSEDPKSPYTKSRRMFWAIRRLNDKWSRTQDVRCLVKSQELAKQWL